VRLDRPPPNLRSESCGERHRDEAGGEVQHLYDPMRGAWKKPLLADAQPENEKSPERTGEDKRSPDARAARESGERPKRQNERKPDGHVDGQKPHEVSGPEQQTEDDLRRTRDADDAPCGCGGEWKG
jgi:hypothetical protein